MVKHLWRALVAMALCVSAIGYVVPAIADCLALNLDARADRPLQAVTLPPPDGCAARVSRDYPIPDPQCTPGAINPTVTVDVLRSPDFRTSCLRDKGTTAHAKAATYDWYGEPHPTNNTGANQTCELDHLVSLELGGADTLDNIWPQCGPPDAVLRARYFKQKDAVENYLAALVRDGTVSLDVAQRGIAQDWTQYLNAACEVQHCD